MADMTCYRQSSPDGKGTLDLACAIVVYHQEVADWLKLIASGISADHTWQSDVLCEYMSLAGVVIRDDHL